MKKSKHCDGYKYCSNLYIYKATVNEKLVSAPKLLAQRTRAGGISLSLCHYLMTLLQTSNYSALR